MAFGELMVALSMVFAQPMSPADYPTMVAPPGTPDTKYCLRVEPITGTRIGGIECLTREQWAQGDVDVDEARTRDGVRTI